MIAALHLILVPFIINMCAVYYQYLQLNHTILQICIDDGIMFEVQL